jgi:hypothetical protein
VIIRFCTYDELDEWVKYKGPRVVKVEGFIQNVGDAQACNIEVYIENYEKAENAWGEWCVVLIESLAPCRADRLRLS